MPDAEPVSAEALACTCGEALAANQWWHLPDCPRAPLDLVANGLAAESTHPVCPACGERLAPGHVRAVPYLGFEVCPGGKAGPAIIITGA